MQTPRTINPTTLIQLSGGIDSTFVLWNWLKNHPEEYCIVHHIVLTNREGRRVHEQTAVQKILAYLDSVGLCNYIYLENSVDYGTIGLTIKDVELCGFFAGMIIRSRRWSSLQEILLPIYKSETGRESVRRELINLIGRKSDFKITYPFAEMTKTDVIERLPTELFDLCWYCRKPVRGIVCGICPTCVEVKDCLKQLL